MTLNFQQKQKSKIFNPKTLLVGLVVLIMFISVPVFAEEEKEGRYKGFIMSDTRSSVSFVVLDSETGSVKWFHQYTTPTPKKLDIRCTKAKSE